MKPRRQAFKQTAIARVYLLGDPVIKRQLLNIAQELEDLGYFISSSWVYDNVVVDDDVAKLCLRNLHELAMSDILLVIGPSRGFKVAYEMGFARASGLRVVTGGISGMQDYDHLPTEIYDTVEDALRAFRRISMFRYKRPKPEEDVEFI